MVPETESSDEALSEQEISDQSKKRKGSLVEFYSSRLCSDVLGKMPFSTIREIYLYRKHLISFYRSGLSCREDNL